MIIKSSESNINTIYLMMGFACNFKCRYCLQSTCDNVLKQEVSETTLNYIKRLVKNRDNEKSKLKIMFWGGEPLLYFDVIKQVVSELQNMVDYGLVTNGSMIDEEFVEFANKWDFAVALSHDGVNTEYTRRYDVLKKDGFVNLFNRLKHKGVLGVVSAYNIDFLSLKENTLRYFNDCGVNVETLNIGWDMPKDLYDIDLDEYKNNLVKVADIACKDIISGEFSLEVNLFYQDLMRCAGMEPEMYKELPTCKQFFNVMNIDLQGNVYVCHNSNISIGTVKDNRVVMASKYTKFLEDSKYDECSTCAYLDMCHGGCPLENEYKKETCKIRRVYYEVVRYLANKLCSCYEPLELEV